MARQQRGYFAVEANDCRPGDRYWFIVDGRELPDPASRSQPEGVFGPSQVVDSSSAERGAEEDAYRGRPLDEYVIYELHVGACTRGGTLADLVPHLDRLAALGVTAIQLMPIAPFSGMRNWGYDGVFPFAVQHSYGGATALRRLVRECHWRRLAVILDVVYNHLGPEGNHLAEFGPYFSSRAHTPWGPAINFDGPHSDEVRRFFLENAQQWISEFNVDALRLDAVHAIHDQSARPFLSELAELCDGLGAQLGRPVFTIAESNRNDPRLLQTKAEGGHGISAQYLDDFQRALHAVLTNERQGHYADFGSLQQLATAFSEGFVMRGQFSRYRRRRHGAPSIHIEPQRFVAYAQNHDTVGNRADGARLTQLADFSKLKLAAAVVLLAPYPPQLFMGEEYGETAPFWYFVNHQSNHLLDAVRIGRRRDFAGSGWQSEPPDPARDETFTASWLDHSISARGNGARLWRYYQRLLTLRRELSLLRRARRDQIMVSAAPERSCLVVQYQSDNERLTLLINFGCDRVAVSELLSPTDASRVLFNSDDSEWRDADVGDDADVLKNSGSAPCRDLQSDSDAFWLNATSCMLLRLE